MWRKVDGLTGDPMFSRQDQSILNGCWLTPRDQLSQATELGTGSENVKQPAANQVRDLYWFNQNLAKEERRDKRQDARGRLFRSVLGTVIIPSFTGCFLSLH
jgi:hypothetical protein